jgi:hypothetical protein
VKSLRITEIPCKTDGNERNPELYRGARCTYLIEPDQTTEAFVSRMSVGAHTSSAKYIVMMRIVNIIHGLIILFILRRGKRRLHGIGVHGDETSSRGSFRVQCMDFFGSVRVCRGDLSATFKVMTSYSNFSPIFYAEFFSRRNHVLDFEEGIPSDLLSKRWCTIDNIDGSSAETYLKSNYLRAYRKSGLSHSNRKSATETLTDTEFVTDHLITIS